MSQEKQFDKHCEGLTQEQVERIAVAYFGGEVHREWCVAAINKALREDRQAVAARSHALQINAVTGKAGVVPEKAPATEGMPGDHGPVTAPSTTPQKPGETPRTDALRKLMGEIYEPDNAALDHMLEKYAELERDLAETTRIVYSRAQSQEQLRERAEQAESALSATPRIPEGWKLVPIKPTAHMIDQALNCLKGLNLTAAAATGNAQTATKKEIQRFKVCSRWWAMLEVVPVEMGPEHALRRPDGGKETP